MSASWKQAVTGVRWMLPILLCGGLPAGCSPEPADRVAEPRDRETDPEPGSTEDPGPAGNWASSEAECRTSPVRITKTDAFDAAYLLQSPGLSCFLRATPIGFAGGIIFNARCRTAGSQEPVDAVYYNINRPDRLSLERARRPGGKAGKAEALRSCDGRASTPAYL